MDSEEYWMVFYQGSSDKRGKASRGEFSPKDAGPAHQSSPLSEVDEYLNECLDEYLDESL